MSDSEAVEVSFDSLPSEEGSLLRNSEHWLTLGGLTDNDSSEFDPRKTNQVAAELASGQIVVGDHQRLIFYSRLGRIRRISGRAGLGPGEFSSIRDLCPQEDSSLAVIDEDGRWSLWDRNGRHLRTNQRIGFIPLRGCSASGSVIVQTAQPGDPEYKPHTRRRVTTLLYSASGALIGNLGSLPAPEYYGQIFFEPGFALYDSLILEADPRTFELTLMDLSTKRIRKRWKVNGALKPIAPSAWDSLIAITVPKSATATARARIMAASSRLGNPGVYPAFHQVRVDLQRRIWLSVYFDERRWFVIDSNGVSLAQVTLPFKSEARPTIAGFTHDGPVVRTLTEEGAISLVFLRLRSPEM